jgi:hypothetical protein
MPDAELPLAVASRRLRRKPGRKPNLLGEASSGTGVNGAPSEPAPDAAPAAHFAGTLPPRGLSLDLASAYSGVPVRTLWRFIAERKLAVVRLPGVRRALVLRDDLDRLLEAALVRAESSATVGLVARPAKRLTAALRGAARRRGSPAGP